MWILWKSSHLHIIVNHEAKTIGTTALNSPVLTQSAVKHFTNKFSPQNQPSINHTQKSDKMQYDPWQSVGEQYECKDSFAVHITFSCRLTYFFSTKWSCARRQQLNLAEKQSQAVSIQTVATRIFALGESKVSYWSRKYFWMVLGP